MNPIRPGELGTQIWKTLRCLVDSPHELSEHLGTLLVDSMPIGGHPYPFRILYQFQKKDGYIVLDQIRAVDGRRLVRRLGKLRAATVDRALGREMFQG